MISKKTLASMSHNIAGAKAGSSVSDAYNNQSCYFTHLWQLMQSTEHIKNTLPFSGVNVILCGDFHQFPPVTGGKYAALYYPNSTSDNESANIGRHLYEQFRTVVILSAQVRVTDIVWRDFLRNLQ